MRGQNKHLTLKERFYIEKALKKKESVRDIAQDLGYDRSTIYREIKKGCYEHLDSSLTVKLEYGSDVGQRVHEEHMQSRPQSKKLHQDDEYLKKIVDLIQNKKYSPEAAWFRTDDRRVCVKTLYNYIHAGYLQGVTVYSLPYAKPKKEKKENVEKRPFSRGTSIEQRPEEIMQRDTYGHWEMDTVYSSKDDLHCLLVLTERMTRDELVFQIPNRTAASVTRSLDKLERKIGSPAFREKFLTITCDNGMEFADWQGIEKSCRTKGNRTKVYFCHPYSSWERGSNENHNRFIRRWIPKGDDIGLYTPQEIAEIQDWINDYPRKMFGGLSSKEYKALYT